MCKRLWKFENVLKLNIKKKKRTKNLSLVKEFYELCVNCFSHLLCVSLCYGWFAGFVLSLLQIDFVCVIENVTIASC